MIIIIMIIMAIIIATTVIDTGTTRSICIIISANTATYK